MTSKKFTYSDQLPARILRFLSNLPRDQDGFITPENLSNFELERVVAIGDVYGEIRYRPVCQS